MGLLERVQPRATQMIVPVLPEMIELVFFVVASVGLCFGFVLHTVLRRIQGCFCYC